MKLINNTEFEKYIHFIDYKKLNINEDLIKNTFLKPSLDKYILLDDYSYLFDKETKLTIYYNKYYWVSKLLSDYIGLYKNDDLNLEQMRFKLLEEGELYPDIDWSVIEEIHSLFSE